MINNRDKWSALSMKDKADLIKIYVSNGITSLDTIRKEYNSFSDGGNTEPIYYDDTYIEPAVVKAFKSQEDYNKFLGERGARAVREGTNRVAQNIFKGLQYTPVIGDAIDISDAVISAKDGNYKKAGILAGLTLIPNTLEKPIKALGKGVKNLRVYNRYTKDANRFRDAVNYSLDKYVKRADLLNENYGGTPKKRVLNSAEDVKNTAYNNPISTDFRLTSLFPFIGGKYNSRTDEIWLNKYRPKLINTAWKDPKVAIKRLEESAVHEGTHLALNHLGDNISIKGERYPIANPNHPLYDRVGYAFADPNRKSNTWARNPEELIANMTRASYNLNLDPNLNVRNWDIKNKNRLSNYLSKAHYFTPEDALFIAEELSDFGYKYGGKLNKFATGGPTENNWEIPFSLEPTTVPITKYDYYTLAPEAVQIPIRDIKQKYAMAPASIALDEAAQIAELKERAAKEYSFGVLSDVLNDIGNQERVNKTMLTSIYHNNQPNNFKYINSSEVDTSPKIKITAPNTDISKFIYGNNISEEAIKEIKQVASKRNLDPYDILAHMLIESSGGFNGITKNSYFNTHDVLDRQISPRLLDPNNSRNIETLLKNLGVYNESRQYTNEEIRDYILDYGKQLQEAVSNLEYPSSTIDAVGLRISKFGRDFNPAQKGFKSSKGEVKNSYLDMINSAITSLKENMPDLFK